MAFSAYVAKLGTVTRWATMLPAGYTINTRPDMQEWLGLDPNGIPYHMGMDGTGHVLDMMRQGLIRTGLVPETRKLFTWVGGTEIVAGPDVDLDIPYTRLTTGSLHELEEQLKHCALYVGHDSGPMCVADVMGAPTLGIFTRTQAERFKPVVHPLSTYTHKTDRDSLTSLVQEILLAKKEQSV